MKILELTNYSAGGCGVFARVKQESLLLAEKHQVYIFSSNHTKGDNKIASSEDKIGKVKIKRFPAKKLGGESFMHWSFQKEVLRLKPDIMIVHSYRHLHTLKALKLAKKINAKVFLVTHAPFIEGDTTRSLKEKLSVKLYDRIIGPKTINKFDKIIAITKWEIPYLIKLGAKKEKIVYIPNGIPKEFFTQKKSKEQNKILFLGRIAPIKDLETLIRSVPLIKNKKIKLEMVGPAEDEYLDKLKKLIKNLNLQDRVIISKPIYEIKQKIKKIDSAKVFVLPSKTEAMPQSLIEAMAREKLTVASNNIGCRDIITDWKNGFLFKIGNPKDLAKKIDHALKANNNKIKKQARKSVEQFSWDKIIDKIEKIL